MAKRGRKPKEKKGYFYEKEEQAIVDYISTNDINEKNRLFDTILYPALTKMIESIIRRYKLYVPDEVFEQTFSDTISYLLTKINNFKQNVMLYDDVNRVTTQIKSEAVEIQESEFETFTKKVTEDKPKYIKVIFRNSSR